MKKGLYISIGLFSVLFVIGNVADHSKAISTWVWILMSMVWAWFATVVYLSPLNNKLILGNAANAIEFISDQPSEKDDARHGIHPDERVRYRKQPNI